MVAKSEPNIVLSNQEFNVVGTRPIRHDGADKVTGRARYSADVHLPGMLYGKVLRSPHAHARIRSIDTSKADVIPGVRAIVTSAALPQPTGILTDIGENAMVNPKFLSNNWPRRRRGRRHQCPHRRTVVGAHRSGLRSPSSRDRSSGSHERRCSGST